jgi:large subunit ribosomal protein L13
MRMKEFTFDATDKKLGRLATEIAVILMGKNDPAYQPNQVAPHKVVVSNASKLAIPAKKLEEKTYAKYSGYPGGLKHVPMNKVVEKKGYSEVLRKAVYGMLPSNKLRNEMMKNLTVTE